MKRIHSETIEIRDEVTIKIGWPEWDLIIDYIYANLEWDTDRPSFLQWGPALAGRHQAPPLHNSISFLTSMRISVKRRTETRRERSSDEP